MIPTTPEAIDRAVEAQRDAHLTLTPTHDSWIPNLLSPEALRALLEGQPRIWTAETIKVAPEGYYIPMFGNDCPMRENEVDGWGLKPASNSTIQVSFWPLWYIKANIDQAVGGVVHRAYGPFPTPPSEESR